LGECRRGKAPDEEHDEGGQPLHGCVLETKRWLPESECRPRPHTSRVTAPVEHSGRLSRAASLSDTSSR
jgi:hypothetical protein